MRVLVTGATGYIGRSVIAALAELGLPSVMVGRARVAGSDFIEADLLQQADFGNLIQQSKATHLIHLAWEARHGAYWTHPDNPRWAIATARLVDAFCASGGQGIVVAGSSAEYDWGYGWCREETTPTSSSTPYGVAKDAARRLTQETTRMAGVPLAWGRIFLSYGSGEDARRLVPSVAAALGGTRPAFAVDTYAYRDFLHVSDVAAALVRLLTSGTNGVANISSGMPVRVAEIITTLAQVIGADPAPMLSLSTARPGDPRLLAGDPARLASLGWVPKLTLAEGLALCAGERP